MSSKKQMMKILPAVVALSKLQGQGRKRKRRMRGAGFFSDLWSGIKSVGSAVAGPVNDLLKATKVVSTLAPMIPVVGSTVGKAAGALGYGRRKRRVVRKRGGMAAHLMVPSTPFYGGRKKRATKKTVKKRGAGQVLKF